ncbi:MAG: DNA repair protein RecN [Chloroflexi bacterium]|nr:DNA repair protein RecN [Chloroflexota bacterium]
MLTELYIRNFAIIDELRLSLAAGFNVLTGETGAGKSIILDAVSLVMGGRADLTAVRAGSGQAYVEATFTLNGTMQAIISPLLADEGLDDEENDILLLARELRQNGRSRARVNGRTVSLALLRQIAAPLIDIHGQGEHLSLLKPRSHLPLLDAYAGLVEERTAVAREVSRLHRLQRELESLRQDERALAQRLDMLQFQIQEIDAAKLTVGEEAELRAERARLGNVEQIMRHAVEALRLIDGVDDESQAIGDTMDQTERALTQLARFDATQAPLLERWQGLTFQLGELAAELSDYRQELEFNPARLNEVEERLELIANLKRKYGVDIATILVLREKVTAELAQIEHSEERAAELEAEQDRYLRRIGELAQALSQKRRAAAQKLAAMVERQMADLRMAGTQFQVDFRVEEAADGAYVGERRLQFDQTGVDQAEFLLSTNPGEPLKPMAKIASGGETARLMLALKTALTQADETPTLIFDEIDQGIGGRVGDIVGRKLWGLTAAANHQVIVVTHLPQLAGYGDAHFGVRKQASAGRTITAVHKLEGDGRIQELAAMLGTQDEHARGGAAAILQQAAQAKAKSG